ncbi:MAG: hypothetical protein U0105_07790 [Candidatus Obscuribacterales bacterium]
MNALELEVHSATSKDGTKYDTKIEIENRNASPATYSEYGE